MPVSGQFHASAALLPQKEVDARASVDSEESRAGCPAP
jgi:hypothetical protein